MRTPPSRLRAAPKKGPSCVPPTPTTDHRPHSPRRFLGFSTTNPPLRRRLRSSSTSGDDYRRSGHLHSGDASADTGGLQAGEEGNEGDEEDALCQRLLLLGAKCWDSEKRYQFVDGFGAGVQPLMEDVEEGRVEEPTPRERRWVKVGCESAAGASFNPSKMEPRGYYAPNH